MLTDEAARVDVDRVLADYDAHGFARLGKIIDDAALASLRARADAIMLGEVRYEGLFFQHDSSTGRYEDLEYKKGYVGASLRYRKVEKLEKDPLFLELIRNGLFERIARAHYKEATSISIYRSVLFTKPERGGTVLPFHQDGGRYWGIDKNPTLQIWTALDDAPIEAGCVEIVPGSHKGGLATPLGGVVPENHVVAANAHAKKIFVPARAGESLLIHNHAWHGSGVNATLQPRRGLTVCFMDGATKCLRTKHAPRSFVRVFDRA